MPAPDCRLGIDVGGTNTDAVIMDTADRVIAKAKVPGTADITCGIVAAIDAVLGTPAVEPQRISHVMLGTTHATNAVLERRNLRRVAVLRIGGPATYSIRPMFGWPADLVQAVSVGAAIVDGGIEFDGQDLSPLDTDAIARFLGQVGDQAQGVVITSVFAPVSARHELLAAEVVKRELGEVHTSLSHEIGSIGLLERENATILNGALAGVARDVARAMRDALTAHGLRPVTFFAQNDGTLMSLDQALRYPVLTIGSGPANSVRGAAFLTGISDSLVADVGGTSTDLGVLANGFPRESSQGVEIGGVRTNFRMPDLVTIALGGGTVVSGDPGLRIGPRSVGYLLPAEALVFGGTTATLTDGAVAAGRADAGRRRPGPARHRALLTEALARADVMLAEAIDRVKTSKEDRPLIAVGGGSILVPDGYPASARSSGRSTSTRRTRSAPPSRRSAARWTGSSTSAPTAGRPSSTRHRTRPASGPSRPAPTRDGADHRGGRDPARLPHLSRGPDPGQGGRHPGRRAGTPPPGPPGSAGAAGRPGGQSTRQHRRHHEAPSRTADRSRGRGRAGPCADRLRRLDQHRASDAATGQQGVHLRHQRPR